MKTMKTAALGAVTLTLAVSVLTVGPAAAAAAAAVADAAPRVIVRYTAQEAATERGARALYRRIAAAARQVCPVPVASNLRGDAASSQCRETAINAAVAATHAPHLVAIAAARRRG